MARKKKTEPDNPDAESAPANAATTAPEIPGNTASSTGENITVRRDTAAKETPTAAPEIVESPDAPTEPEAGLPDEPTAGSKNNELSPGDQTADIEDQANGDAVDDIAAHEADTMLAVQDALDRKHSQPPKKPGLKDRLKRLLKSRRTWFAILIIILALFVIPTTRYKLLGLVIKKPLTVTVIDSQTNTPVSDGLVTLHGVSAKTNPNGRATLKTQPGPGQLSVNKRYYLAANKQVSVGLFTAKTTTRLRLVATGRQVPVTIINKLTGQPLANAQVSALKTTVKTNARGKAVIVLPAGASSDQGAVSLKNYNTAKITITVTNSVVSGNTFQVVPSGHVYFLSNVGGMNVVKANLDGSNEQTVLAGTGQEDGTSISLLASRDWRYLVLKSRRDTAQPVLYLIDTSNDKLTPFDTNNGNFSLIGWSGHNFMYDFTSNTTPQSQAGHEIIKSYDADHQQLNQLDQSQAAGGTDSYGFQDFYNFSVLNNQLVYNTQWFSVGADITGKNASIRAVQPTGQNKKDYQTFPSAGLNYVLSALYQPQAIYYEVYNGAANQTAYYNFANQTVNGANIDQSYFKQAYPTYLVSPGGNQTFWAGTQNGQSGLFIGDTNAQHPRQLGELSGYQPYGWFSDDYLLLSKGGTDLYIMPAAGLKPGQQPTKISYYYQPVTKYPNYGYGYGGL